MANEKAIELAKKLLALTNSNNVNEAKLAFDMLQKLLAKHNMRVEDLEDNERRKCWYDIAMKHKELFFQCVWNTVEDWSGNYYVNRKDRRAVGLMLTKAEELELTAKFDFYVREYDKQLEQFTNAFIHANQIYAKHSPEYKTKPSKRKSMSLEDQIRLEQMIGGIRVTPFLKQIEC